MAKKVKRTELAWGIWSDYGRYFLPEFYGSRAHARDVHRLYSSGFRVIRVRITEVR